MLLNLRSIAVTAVLARLPTARIREKARRKAARYR